VGASLVSVVIATYNRNESLCRTINCWLRQHDSNFEIIVVDQSREHDPETRSFLDSVSGRIRYFFVDRPNLPAARNFGVTQSIGDIVLFCDDDMDIPPDVVTKIAKRYASDPAISGVTGVMFDVGSEAVPDPVDRIEPTTTFAGGFMSFRGEVIEAAGFFDEWLGSLPHGAGEDFEFTYRVSRRFTLIRDRNIVVCHLGNHLSGGCERLGIRSRGAAKLDTSEADMFAGMYAYWKNRRRGISGLVEAFWLSYHGYVLNYELLARGFDGGWKRHVCFGRVMRRLLKKPWRQAHASC